MVSQEYQGYDGPPKDVEITITFRMPSRWCDAASSMKIDFAEYARRRLVMTDLLTSADESGVFHPLELTARKVD